MDRYRAAWKRGSIHSAIRPPFSLQPSSVVVSPFFHPPNLPAVLKAAERKTRSPYSRSSVPRREKGRGSPWLVTWSPDIRDRKLRTGKLQAIASERTPLVPLSVGVRGFSFKLYNEPIRYNVLACPPFSEQSEE